MNEKAWLMHRLFQLLMLQIKLFSFFQTAFLEPLELSAARHATAKVAYVTGKQELVSPSHSLPKLQANSKMSHQQV